MKKPRRIFRARRPSIEEGDVPLFRIKFILEDGRKVYMSKRGLIHLQDREGADFCIRLRMGPTANDMAYLDDLSAYGSRCLYEPAGRTMVGIVLAVSEPADRPVDPAAFVLGGVPARVVGTIGP